MKNSLLYKINRLDNNQIIFINDSNLINLDIIKNDISDNHFYIIDVSLFIELININNKDLKICFAN